jgi:hypothetical protein
MARRRPKVLRRLRITEGSLVRAGANPGAVVTFFKSREGKGMDYVDVLKQAVEPAPELTGRYDRGEISEAMAELAKELHPDLPAEQGILKAWGTPAMSSLYALHEESPLEEIEEPVRKVDEPGSAAWAMITKAARAIMAEAPVTLAEATAMACERDPSLYQRYVREQAGQDGD